MAGLSFSRKLLGAYPTHLETVLADLQLRGWQSLDCPCRLPLPNSADHPPLATLYLYPSRFFHWPVGRLADSVTSRLVARACSGE
jgi:hypothetical protein